MKKVYQINESTKEAPYELFSGLFGGKLEGDENFCFQNLRDKMPSLTETLRTEANLPMPGALLLSRILRILHTCVAQSQELIIVPSLDLEHCELMPVAIEDEQFAMEAVFNKIRWWFVLENEVQRVDISTIITEQYRYNKMGRLELDRVAFEFPESVVDGYRGLIEALLMEQEVKVWGSGIEYILGKLNANGQRDFTATCVGKIAVAYQSSLSSSEADHCLVWQLTMLLPALLRQYDRDTIVEGWGNIYEVKLASFICKMLASLLVIPVPSFTPIDSSILSEQPWTIVSRCRDILEFVFGAVGAKEIKFTPKQLAQVASGIYDILSTLGGLLATWHVGENEIPQYRFFRPVSTELDRVHDVAAKILSNPEYQSLLEQDQELWDGITLLSNQQ